MNAKPESNVRMPGFRWLPLAIISLTLATFAVTLFVVSRHFQHKIRDQIITREGDILHSVAVMQLLAEAEADPAFSVAEPAAQFNLLLKTSRLKGVMGVRLFSPDGRFVTAFPEYVADGELGAADLQRLRQVKPISRFYPEARLSDWFLSVPRQVRGRGHTVPMLEVIVPLHELDHEQLIGAAQFMIDGQGLAAEFGSLGQVLLLQPALLFGLGAVVIVAGLGWAFHRLRQQSARLLQANLELALAAKTSAVGTITAHLIHGLKNPLFGLQSIVMGQQLADSGKSDPNWQTALEATHRMQAMINRVLDVLRYQDGMAEEEVTLRELAGALNGKMAPLAQDAGIQFSVVSEAEGVVPAHVGNLVLLILANLIQNAIEATPRGRAVGLRFAREAGQVVCEVADEGPGVPDLLAGNLFSPCQSSKSGGSGIGLTISKQLANHLGARLELKTTSPHGSVFVLRLPAKLFIDQTLLAV